MACNGGHVDYEFKIQFESGASELMSFSGFYALMDPGSWETNPFELREARKQDGFPQHGVLPVARDGGGSQLYLDLREGCRVMSFVHGLPAWTGLREQDTLIQVAASFSEYWSGLLISDEYAEDFIEHYEPAYGDAALAAEWLDTGNPNWRDKFSRLWEQHVVNATPKESG